MSDQGETKCIPTTNKNYDSLLNTHFTIEDWRQFAKTKLKLGEDDEEEGGGGREGGEEG